MKEKYFEYILSFVLLLSVVLPVMWLHLNIKLKHLQKLVMLRIMKKQQRSEKTVLFASVILNECCRILFLSFNKKARVALQFLTVGKVQKAVDYFKMQRPQLALLLEAHLNADSAYKKMLKQKKIWYEDCKYGVFLPLLAHLLFDIKTQSAAIQKLASKKLGKCAGAYYKYIAAGAYLYDGDMLSASQNCSAASEYFRKKKYSVETVMCYLLLGKIYRLSCVNDVAQTMIEAAVKINKEQKMPQFLAQSIAELGMLMLFENRYEEAEDRFNQAFDLAVSDNLKADICNQRALLYIARNKLEEAQKNLSMASDIFNRLENNHGKAFTLQLKAQNLFNEKKYAKGLKMAEQAAILYKQNNNISAELECNYLRSDILFRQNKLKKSEELLRQIIDTGKKKKHNFHISNAYSLLGLIYLYKGELQRAKVLLQQSLHLEQRHRRCEGLVSDYTNLAVIDVLSGNRDAAADNMKIALEYAKQTGNDELIALIEKKSQEI